MKIKWTPDNDQILLVKILETSDIRVDTARVAEAWPTEDKPTARAIAERLFRIRKGSRDDGDASAFKIGFKDGRNRSTTGKTPSRNPAKVSSDEEVNPDDPIPSTETTAPKPQPKKKRGRPRKEAEVKPEPVDFAEYSSLALESLNDANGLWAMNGNGDDHGQVDGPRAKKSKVANVRIVGLPEEEDGATQEMAELKAELKSEGVHGPDFVLE